MNVNFNTFFVNFYKYSISDDHPNHILDSFLSTTIKDFQVLQIRLHTMIS